MQQPYERETLFLCFERNNNNLTAGKSFSTVLLPPKTKYFKNDFREMYDLKGH